MRFKLYRKSLHSSQFYKSWQIKLLNHEILDKRRRICELETSRKKDRSLLDEKLSVIDRCIVGWAVNRSVGHYEKNIECNHERKLSHLGVFNSLNPCDPESVVHNFSSIRLPTKIKTFLAFGLDFCLPIYNLDFYKYFLPIEKIAYVLSKEPCLGDINSFFHKFKDLSYKYYYTFKSSKVFSPFFRPSDIKLLKTFSKKFKSEIVVSSPDKGRGVVIVDKPVYLQSMLRLLSNSHTFKMITEPIQKYSWRIEDRINRFLLKIKKQNIISDSVYEDLHVTGSGPGILYGLPKIHKPDFSSKFQYRPIFAAYNQPSYKIAKHLVPLLSDLTTNQYTVRNSEEFAQKIISTRHADEFFMASFDIESLFTNIPIQETIEICVNILFSNSSTVFGFTKSIFKNFLELAVKNSFFIFNGKYYEQTEGLGMGLPLGPTFANIFMCFHEQNWLANCPPDFKPVVYNRYIDDTFLLFRDESHCTLFFNYLNQQHSSIKFTVETETNNSLSFLDCKVMRCGDQFCTSVFRKNSFTGLTMSFFSFCCKRFKLNSVKTLIFRAYNICSSYTSLHLEFQFLVDMFFQNGYPKSLIQNTINKFLS